MRAARRAGPAALLASMLTCALGCHRDRALGSEGTRVEPPAFCEAWIGTSGKDDCAFTWSQCADAIDRQIRCGRTATGYRCACILGVGSITEFESPDFCELGTGSMTVDRAAYAEAAGRVCGFHFAP